MSGSDIRFLRALITSLQARENVKMVQGLDHGWWLPASDELWRFFARHSL